ncbi:MAG: lysophospholipase [Dehalococcoidia bacterium]|nr:lysophospholipase [Dehalococcoidia bacterium]
MEHCEGTFTGRGKLKLYYQSWQNSRTPKAVLLIVHGLADHSGRYINVVDFFVPRGFAVYSYDQRGHGKSEGTPCFVRRFSDYTDDLKAFHSLVREKHPQDKTFLVGHSMGGTVAADYAIQHPAGLVGLVLSGPLLKAGESVTNAQIIMARLLSALLPKIGIAAIDTTGISRDKAVVTAYVNDPLVHHGKITARTGAELITTIEKRLPEKMNELTLPLLIMCGTQDRLANPRGSDLLYEKAKSTHKTLKRYDGFYHEIFNEPGREQVFADMEKWLSGHL